MKIAMKIIYLLISFSWVSEWSKLILTIQPEGDLITRYNNLMWINSNFVVLKWKWWWKKGSASFCDFFIIPTSKRNVIMIHYRFLGLE